LKILIYTQYWKKGGIERLVKYLVDNLSEIESGYQFSILTEDVPSPGEQFDLGRGVKVFFRKFTPFNLVNQSKMREFVDWLNPDIVVTMGSTRALSRIPRALVGSDYPVIISEHNCATEMLRKFHNDIRFLNSVRYFADLNHFIFEEFSSDFDRTESVRVVSNPICSSSLRADVCSSQSPKIVHVGRFQIDQKQQDVLVRSFALIADEFPSWTLELYGGDWFGAKAKIKALVDELGLSDRVLLKGETDQVEKVLSSAQLFAFPSAFEGFGLVVGEALAVGLPVVAFAHCDGVNRLVHDRENGILVDGSVRSHVAFSRGLKLMMEDADLRSRLSSGALASVNDFSLELFLKGWSDIFDEAYRMRGRNRLRLLSNVERDYLELVASGKLFDEKFANLRRLKRLNKVKGLLKRYYLWPIMRFVYKRLFSK